MATDERISTIPPFSAKLLEAAQPREKDYELSDGGAAGLRLRVTPRGAKVFRWYLTSLGRVVTIGRWSKTSRPGFVTLGEARRWLERLKVARVAGETELEAVLAELGRQLKPPAPVTGTGETLARIAEEFYRRRIVPHRKRPEAARRVLDLDILPVLGATTLDALTTRSCAAAIERVVDRGAPVHAGKVLGVLKQLLRFAQARGYSDRNPAAPLDPKDLGVLLGRSDRWLDEKEIPLFWKALDRERTAPAPDKNGKVQRRIVLEPTTKAGLRLLLMTGVRTGELLAAEWPEIDFDTATWTIPVAHSKYTKDQAQKAKPFVVPLAPTALGLFRELQRLAGKSRWIMASDDADGGHFTDKSLGRAMRRLFENKHPILTLPGGPASPHDLRRTVRTHLAKLRVPLHVVERCLNHSLGRIVMIYDQHDYLPERREALERWDGYVQRLLTGKGAEVVPLVAKGA